MQNNHNSTITCSLPACLVFFAEDLLQFAQVYMLTNHSKIQINCHSAIKNIWRKYSLKTSDPLSKADDNKHNWKHFHMLLKSVLPMTHYIKQSHCFLSSKILYVSDNIHIWNVQLPGFCYLSNKLSISIQGRSHWISVTSCLVLGISCWTLSLLNAPFGQTRNFSLKSMCKHCRYLIQRAMWHKSSQ